MAEKPTPEAAADPTATPEFQAALKAEIARMKADIMADVKEAMKGAAPNDREDMRSLFGSDAGIGGIRPQLEVLVTTAFTTGNSATLNIQFQAAVDTGAGGGNQPGTWNTLSETGPIAVANLGLGAVLARWDFFASLPVNLQPRYLRLNFAPAAATNFTAGAVVAPVVLVRDDQANKFTPANYAVA